MVTTRMSVMRFYDNYLNDGSYSQNPHKDEDRQYRDYLIRNFRRFLPEDKAVEILEIGVGDGRALRALRELGYGRSLGIDIARELVEKVKVQGLACEYVENTVAYLREHKDTYSFIFLSHVIEHIAKEEIENFISGIQEALVEGGYVAMVTPSVQNIFYVGPFYDFTHVNFFTERSLHQVCEAGGFTTISVRAEKMPLNTYGRGMFSFFRYLIGDMIIRISRIVINALLRLIRASIGALNPKVLSLNLVCICRKQDKK